LVDRVCEPGQALSCALEAAVGLGAASPLAVAITKAAFAKGCSTLEDALRVEVDHQPNLYLSQDHLDALAAFRERRAAVFRGV
jgi:hypothetical protein